MTRGKQTKAEGQGPPPLVSAQQKKPQRAGRVSRDGSRRGQNPNSQKNLHPFQPGQSGNPAGGRRRPRIIDELSQYLMQRVEGTDNERKDYLVKLLADKMLMWLSGKPHGERHVPDRVGIFITKTVLDRVAPRPRDDDLEDDAPRFVRTPFAVPEGLGSAGYDADDPDDVPGDVPPADRGGT